MKAAPTESQTNDNSNSISELATPKSPGDQISGAITPNSESVADPDEHQKEKQRDTRVQHLGLLSCRTVSTDRCGRPARTGQTKLDFFWN